MTFLSSGNANPFCPNLYAPLLTPSEAASFALVAYMKQRIVKMEVHHSALIDTFCDMYRDFPGRFYDPEAGLLNPLTGRFQEAFVDTEPLIEAPVEWWRDNFSPAHASKPILRLRSEARPRWQALGSIYFAYHPWDRSTWQAEVANDNAPPRTT